ncbi:MAG: ArsR/SmtB family transcription factor [Promethearchaeati archaeon]
MNEEKLKNGKLIENLLGSRARVKILKLLAFKTELNISAIIKKTNLNHKNVDKHLKYLKKVDLVQQKNFGRIRIYRFKEENIKARSFKNFLKIWEEK